ncbi:hypothetical protein CBR_g34086 [Chara braunii]|uniref:HAT C-terminal dimerisation domain-containing protein n=1 Tax=Chara braunii TaxID=69332 RepID=A0A388LI33_CHABU|nr:hypothetical protein CBR_g34086 [Chara braunii]|eukprot:GBG81903.1 hypothetical protein CBR_g34086 [Chara braunii]
MVDTRRGTSTMPYTKEEEAKMAAILQERKEEEAKKMALQEEQAAKLRKIEEEMAREKERLKKEEEQKLKEVEEEEEEDDQPLERRREQRGQYSGSKDDEMEKRISEWVANLSLGEEEEVAIQDMAVRSIRMGFRDFARELVGAIGSEVNHRLENTQRFCVGAIEGVQAAAPKEEEPLPPRREPVKVKFPDSYSGKKEENFDNWEANVKTYAHLQQVSPDQQVLIAIHALRDEAASFARSLVRAANCSDDPVAYSAFTSLTEFMRLLRERFADVARSVKASDRLQTIHALVNNDAQKKLDTAWAEAMFCAGIPFNFLNFETTQKLHEVYLQVAKSRPQVKLPSFNHMRTVMLDIVYMRVQKTVEPLTTCWDVSECTFITDISSDRREQPVMNFLAAGVDGAVLVATVSMSGRKKTGPALAKLWEQIMREIGLRRLNAICTDNAEVGGEWKGQAHLDIWSDLNEFYNKPTRNGPKRNDTKMWDPTAKADVDKKTPSEWWAAHGGDVPELQKIAIKVMGMWSTASPAERNWASMDFIHSKRRNKLLPESVAKLVYIHWNMQLLRVPETKNNGFMDLWCDFVEPAPEPEENDGSVSKGPEDEAEKTEEELVRERRLTKTSKGRVPKNLEDKDEELTDDSDLDDKLWKGKCGLSEDSSGSEEDDDDDSDFELRPEPSVPGTTYVERRRTGRKHREEPRPTAMEPGVRETALYNPQSDVEFARLDTDVEMLLETRVDEDEEDANRAKAMADWETELVNKRMMEEEARRAAIPTRREIERGLKQAREHQQQINQALEVEEEGEEEEEEHQAEVGDYMEQEEEAEGMVQPQEGEEMEHQEEEEGTLQGGEEEEMQQEEEGEGLAQQKMQHGEVDTAREDEPHPTATAVYTRRPRPADFRSPRRRYRNSPQ